MSALKLSLRKHSSAFLYKKHCDFVLNAPSAVILEVNKKCTQHTQLRPTTLSWKIGRFLIKSSVLRSNVN